MKRSKITVFLFLTFIFILISGINLLYPVLTNAEDEWKKEFEDICSKTDIAMTLTDDEIKNLILRCDKLKPSIEKLDEAPKKVYLKRLQSCRDLFVFVLESKKEK
ncbi:MAG: hypothetical protein HY755_02100 [Nitrospirae bacterium]|nr:hypothetical protein [Nitrospirota bacterium]